MLYRDLGRTGAKVSALGFGCMRLPIVGGKTASDVFNPNNPIEEKEAMRMVSYAIDNGVNYFDTAYPYHGGQSEPFIGRALKPHRGKVMIATKLPAWLVEGKGDLDRFLNEQLQKLQTDHFDVYLLHSLGRATWKKMQEVDAFSFMSRAKKEGKVRFVGFSFHDDFACFQEIADAHPWDVCQIQYNYYDEHFQAGKKGLEHAAAKGIGVIVMEPVRGGKLAGHIPKEIQAVWDTAPVKRTPAEWALRWVWNHEHVSTVLTGASSLAQLQENVRAAASAWPGSLSAEELARVRKVTELYRTMLKVPCTSCAYCMPCPNGVDIPMNFSLYNDSFMFPHDDMAVMMYNNFLGPEQKASSCKSCEACAAHCPQKLDIVKELQHVHQRLMLMPK